MESTDPKVASFERFFPVRAAGFGEVRRVFVRARPLIRLFDQQFFVLSLVVVLAHQAGMHGSHSVSIRYRDRGLRDSKSEFGAKYSMRERRRALGL